MTTGTSAVGHIFPIAKGSEAAEVALAAYHQLFALLHSLDGEEWGAATECPG